MVKRILVQNLKHYRRRRKLTQEEVAEIAGITGKYWQRLEMTSQTDLPSLPVLFRLAAALNVTPGKLLEER